MIKPLNNMCLVEIIDEYDGLVGRDEQATVQKGVLRGVTLVRDHLTASTGYEIVGMEDYGQMLNDMVGKTVYWEQYSDIGKNFEIDGKQYSLVPFYRLIAVEEN